MDWRQLIDQGETPNVDFKAACKWDGEERVRLAKAIAAMANTRDGGFLIIGVNDDRRGGRPQLAGLSPEQLVSFDPTKVAQFVNSYFEPDIRLRIEKPIVDEHSLAAIVVNEFEDQPHICVKEGLSGGRQHFRPGDLLIRTAAAQSTGAGPQELRDLLGRAISKKGDHLLEQVRHIVRGAPPLEERDWRTLLGQELTEWSDTISSLNQTSTHGGWNFTTVPMAPPDLPVPHTVLSEAVKRAQVSLRGWNFPHTGQEQFENRTSRIAFNASYNRFIEHWSIFRRLMFGDFRSFFEDTWELGSRNTSPGGSELSFIGAIYMIAEFVLFTKRFYASLNYEGELLLQIHLTGCKGRRLVSKEFLRHLSNNYVCVEPDIHIERRVHTTDLAAGWEEHAADLVQELFALFNWSNPSRDMILKDISDLRDRKP